MCFQIGDVGFSGLEHWISGPGLGYGPVSHGRQGGHDVDEGKEDSTNLGRCFVSRVICLGLALTSSADAKKNKSGTQTKNHRSDAKGPTPIVPTNSLFLRHLCLRIHHNWNVPWRDKKRQARSTSSILHPALTFGWYIQWQKLRDKLAHI